MHLSDDGIAGNDNEATAEFFRNVLGAPTILPHLFKKRDALIVPVAFLLHLTVLFQAL
jgi:hypothetical protein